MDDPRPPNARRHATLAVTVALGLLVGSGLGAAAFGPELARLAVENHGLRQDVRALSAGGIYVDGAPADYPTSLDAATAEGYVATHWGICQEDAGYHYTKTTPDYRGPHLLFASDGAFLGYKFLVPASGTDGPMPDPWTLSRGHPGVPGAHWDLFLFVRDPAGACRR